MAQTIRDVMTPDPITLPTTALVSDAARLMRERDIGTIVVVKPDGRLCGVVTDRDIVVRAVGGRRDPWNTQMDEICSHDDLATVTPDTPIDEAITYLRGKAIRRLPVVEKNQVIGMVSIGDLALARDRTSALADIAAAPPNR